MAERLILIDPSDIEYPPCLNLFDLGLERAGNYIPVEREKLLNGAVSIYEYIFGALLGAELTSRQHVIFRYLAMLLMVVPNATTYTLMDFLENPGNAQPYVFKLDPTAQRFFTTQFFAPIFDNTRQQILTRLWDILSSPALGRIFGHPYNKLNMFEAMNRGGLILINTSKEVLKRSGTEIFGRFMIALIAQATQERAAIPENQRIPTFVYIDEAHDYFRGGNEMLEQLISQGGSTAWG